MGAGLDWIKDLLGIGEGTGLFGGDSGLGINDPWDDPATDFGANYEMQAQALLAELNALGAGGFQRIWDTAAGTAEDMFGDTGQTAGEWGEQAGAIDYGQSFSDWMAEHGYGELDLGADQEGMQALIDQLANPDTEEGFSHSARMLGFASDEEAQAALESFRLAMEGGAEGQAGISPEDMALRERMNQANMREMEARSKRLVQNSFANTGSFVRMLAASDEAARGLSLAQFRQDEGLAREQVERQMTQWNEQASMYTRMVETRQMSYSQFMQMKTQSISAAIEGYSSKISSMIAENAQYLQQHGGDMAILEANANRMFAMAHFQEGLTLDIYKTTKDLYAQKVQQYIDRINMLTATGMLDPNSDAFGQLMEYLTTIATIVVSAI